VAAPPPGTAKSLLFFNFFYAFFSFCSPLSIPTLKNFNKSETRPRSVKRKETEEEIPYLCVGFGSSASLLLLCVCCVCAGRCVDVLLSACVRLCCCSGLYVVRGCVCGSVWLRVRVWCLLVRFRACSVPSSLSFFPVFLLDSDCRYL